MLCVHDKTLPKALLHLASSLCSVSSPHVGKSNVFLLHLQSQCLCSTQRDPRPNPITEFLSWKGPLKSIGPALPAMNRDSYISIKCSEPLHPEHLQTPSSIMNVHPYITDHYSTFCSSRSVGRHPFHDGFLPQRSSLPPLASPHQNEGQQDFIYEVQKEFSQPISWKKKK